MAPQASTIVRAHGDIRGTQSFVGVMAMVWRRPALTAMEIAWRWAFGLCSGALLLAAFHFHHGARVQTHVAAVRSAAHAFSVTNPFAASDQFAAVVPQLWHELVRIFWSPLATIAVLWLLISTFGRAAVLHRLGLSLRPRYGVLFLLNALRFFAFTACGALWLAALYVDARVTVIRALNRSSEPNFVLYFALGVAATMVLFVVWSACSWVLRLAPVLAVARDLGAGPALRAAVRQGELRAKLVEINLVMGIVKVALVVLAMVFSATPLPFETYATQDFLVAWWVGVALLYFVASDFFHVVHTAAFLQLWRAYDEA